MPRARRPGLIGKGIDRLEEATGMAAIKKEDLAFLQEAYVDYRALSRDIEDFGWSVMDYMGGNPQELRPQHRFGTIQKARYVWLNDPQAGAAVELMNDFTFGRGVPAPRCKDKEVQKIVDDAWNDPDNQEVLTSLEAQLALGTDLALQSNFFVLMFDDGEDGRVKLSLLRHDDVIDAIADPDKRHRVLWYVTKRPLKHTYDFVNGRWDTTTAPSDPDQLKPIYFPHWRNVELAAEEQGRDEPAPMPPDDMVGDGKVYHARINRYSEMKFGAPRFQRTLRWYTAYNDFVKARIDVAQAAAAFIMKRKVRGTPNQLARDAAKLVSRSGLLAQGLVDRPEGAPMVPPKPGSMLEENESVSHEALSLPSGAADAQQDANIIRAPISAAERFSQAYFGDASQSNLATATSLELPILKAVEARQEVFEGVFRWFIDRVIELAVDKNLITDELTPEEIEDYTVAPDVLSAALQAAVDSENGKLRVVLDVRRVDGAKLEESLGGEVWIVASRDLDGRTHFRVVEALERGRLRELQESHEDQILDEEMLKRDLSYEFSMPSPLRRMMGDLISAITQIAQVFDPNNTNNELSRALLTIALGEGLEVQDAPDLVEKILPAGYQDPLLQAQMAAAGGVPGQAPTDSTSPAGGDQQNGAGYGAPMGSTMPENQSGVYAAQQAIYTRDRLGNTLRLNQRLPLVEGDRREVLRPQTDGAKVDEMDEFDREVASVALERLDDHRVAPHRNGGTS